MVMASDALSVLVIDPDPDTADSMATILEVCGLAVRSATSAADALAAVSECRPDVVVLELRLAGTDGCELARRFARFEKPPLLIAHTVLGDPDDFERSAAAGVHLHLVKPADSTVILRALRRFAETTAPGADSPPPG